MSWDGRRRRRVAMLLLALLGVVAVVGHVMFWYQARERPGVPSAGLAAALLADDTFDAAVWMPYPHQNLGRLRAVAGFEGDALAAMARLGGLPSPELPGFGSMAVPPARELAVASSEDGSHFVLAAKVYPAFAAFARLSGRLANNPWLAGGEVVRQEQRLRVAWRDGWWTVTTGEWSLPESPQQSEPDGEGSALAFLQLHRPPEGFPAGRYALRRDGSMLELTSTARFDGAPPWNDGRMVELGAFLLALEALPEPPSSTPRPPRFLAFFSLDDVDLPELPRATSIRAPGALRWELPGESILGLTGREPRAAEVDGWGAESLDSAGLEQARQLVPVLQPLASEPLSLGVWLDLEAGLAEVSRLVGILEEVPLVPRRRVQRWRDVETVLEATAHHFDRLTVEVGTEPARFRLRLAPTALYSEPGG